MTAGHDALMRSIAAIVPAAIGARLCLRVRRRTSGAAVVLALLLGGVAPGHAALFGDDTARREIAQERKRVDELSGLLETQKQQLDALQARMTKLQEAQLKDQALLDLLREIENLKLEIARMRGQLEVLGNNIDVVQKRQKDFYVDLDSRLRRLESPVVPVMPGTAAEATPGERPSGAATADTAAETRAYEAAQNLRRIGNFQGAIVAFQNFVKQHPKSALAPNAQYWVGDSYFNLRDFRLAIASQRALLSAYPDSPKVADALLNIASSQAELGEIQAARKTMEEIVAKYPKSEAADRARRRLASLK